MEFTDIVGTFEIEFRWEKQSERWDSKKEFFFSF